MVTLERFTEIAKCAIRNITDEQAEAIGKLSFEAQASGNVSNIWHSSSRYFGHKCNCAVCNPNR